jgi:hypothetical protein
MKKTQQEYMRPIALILGAGNPEGWKVAYDTVGGLLVIAKTPKEPITAEMIAEARKTTGVEVTKGDSVIVMFDRQDEAMRYANSKGGKR